MVIFRQIAPKISVNSYKISSYKSCFLVKNLLTGKWLIFNSFGNCDQITIAAPSPIPSQLVFQEYQAAVSAKPN